METNTYLTFNGQCEAAFKLYEQVLGGQIEGLMRFSEAPCCDEMPAEIMDQVIHVAMKLGGHYLMGSDAPPGKYEKPAGFAVNVEVESVAEAERVFNALADNGAVTMPLQETFWTARFGMLVDRFGTPWMINCSCQQ